MSNVNLFGEGDADQQQETENKVAMVVEEHRRTNDEAVNKALNFLLKKPKEALSLAEKRFIKARASYMTESERRDYKDIIEADLTDEGVNSAPTQNAQVPGSQNSVVAEPTRSELNKEAEELGIENPEKLPNKQAVVDAIKAVRDAANEEEAAE